MNTDDIDELDELERLVQAESDPEARARLLDVDLIELAAAIRRELVWNWVAAAALSLGVIITALTRLLILAHGDPDGWLRNFLFLIMIGMATTWFTERVLKSYAMMVGALIRHALSARPWAGYLLALAALCLLMVGIRLAEVELDSRFTPLVIGLIAGLPIANVPRAADIDLARAIRLGHPRIAHVISVQRSVQSIQTRAGCRARWLVGESVSSGLFLTASLALLTFSPWAALPIAASIWLSHVLMAEFKERGQYRRAVFTMAGFALILVGVFFAVTVVVGGNVMWPTVHWTDPPISA